MVLPTDERPRRTSMIAARVFLDAVLARVWLAVLAGTVLAAAPAAAASGGSTPPGAAPGSPAYMARDVANMQAAFGREIASGGQLRNPAYARALATDDPAVWLAQMRAQAASPTRPAITGGNLVPGWNGGNPLRAGWRGTRGIEVPVAFTAGDGALLRGQLFAPRPGARDPYTGAALAPPYPGVVVVTGSLQASAGDYTWLAEDLAERGYLVLTYDVQGQGTSETFPHAPSPGPAGVVPCDPAAAPARGQSTGCEGTPSEQQANFDDTAEDAVDFFLSTPSQPYTAGGGRAPGTDAFNPMWALFDHSPDTASATPGHTTRLALIGHSTGAVTVSYLQQVDPRVETVVALDKLTATCAAIADDEAALGSLPVPCPLTPRVPALALQSEYGFEPQPYWLADCSSFEPCLGPRGVSAPRLRSPPDPHREEATGFDAWRRADVDSMVIVPRASTHLDYTDVPLVLPASQDGQAMASYYVQAWLGKYLKHEASADASLLSERIDYLEPTGNGVWSMVHFDRDSHLSFYFCSGYQWRVAGGAMASNGDLDSAGCG